MGPRVAVSLNQDGVWDALLNQEVVIIVRHVLIPTTCLPVAADVILLGNVCQFCFFSP